MARSGIIPVALALIPTAFSSFNSTNVKPSTQYLGHIVFGGWLIRQGGSIFNDDGINDKTVHIEVNGARVASTVTSTDLLDHPGFFAGFYPAPAEPPLQAGTYNVEAVFDGDTVYAGCKKPESATPLSLIALAGLALALLL